MQVHAFEGLDLSSVDEVCRTLEAAAEAGHNAACRRGPIDWVEGPGRLVATGDIHDNPLHLSRVIEAAGLDVHVVFVASAADFTVPPPLGSDPSRFLHVDQVVSSSNSLEVLLSSYDMYASFLRREANLHFIVTTDDESNMDATTFRSMMQANVAKTFRFHSIASPPGSTHTMPPFPITMNGCAGPHGEAADNGEVYWELSGMTSGLTLSICTADWSTLFDELTRAIAIPEMLPCTYEIPAPPPGETFDPNRVNVEYTPGSGGAPELIPNVRTIDGCSGEGWYYDDPESPTQVQLCPFTCRRLEGDAAGKVDVAFGCMTVII